MINNLQAIVYDWDDVITRTAYGYFQLLQETSKKLESRQFTFEVASSAGLHFVGVSTGITEKVKFINNGVSSSMIIPSIVELREYLKGGLNGWWTTWTSIW